MGALSEGAVQPLALCAALWLALFEYQRRAPRTTDAARFVLGLGLGALLAHLGWALLHASALRLQPAALFELRSGFSILFVPLGPLLVAPWRAGRRRAWSFAGTALGCLPLAFCAARVGCLVAGCCHGTPTTLPWGLVRGEAGIGVHPTPLYEMAGWLLLHASTRRVRASRVAPLALVGFGLVRLAVAPWRAEPPLGAPDISPSALAAGWLVLGVLSLASTRSGEGQGGV